MDNASMVGLNLQRVLRERMDIVANNLANMNTVGFKTEHALAELVVERPAVAEDRPKDVRFANHYGLHRDMRAGALEATGNPLDLALEDPNAFFAIQVGDKEFYTRDGRFALDELSRLVTREGGLVLDQAGAEIVLDPEGPRPSVSASGILRQGNLEIAPLKIVRFETPAALERRGDNLWAATIEPDPALSDTPAVRQGFTESSNVKAVVELTNMIEIAKAYESASRIVKNTDDMRERAIERLGRVS